MSERAKGTVTREGFRLLPALLSRQEFLWVTGLGKAGLRALVDAKELEVWYPPNVAKGRAKSYGKYRKVDAARLAGIEEWLR